MQQPGNNVGFNQFFVDSFFAGLGEHFFGDIHTDKPGASGLISQASKPRAAAKIHKGAFNRSRKVSKASDNAVIKLLENQLVIISKIVKKLFNIIFIFQFSLQCSADMDGKGVVRSLSAPVLRNFDGCFGFLSVQKSQCFGNVDRKFSGFRPLVERIEKQPQSFFIFADILKNDAQVVADFGDSGINDDGGAIFFQRFGQSFLPVEHVCIVYVGVKVLRRQFQCPFIMFFGRFIFAGGGFKICQINQGRNRTRIERQRFLKTDAGFGRIFLCQTDKPGQYFNFRIGRCIG